MAQQIIPPATRRPGDFDDHSATRTLVLTACPPDRKVTVIKVIRDITGLRLKEAKDLAEGVSGLLAFLAASVACGFAPSLAILVAARFVQGAGAAVMMPSSMALIGQAYPDPRRREGAVAAWAMGGSIAATSGPALGGLLTEFSWRWIFFINVPVGLLLQKTNLRPVWKREMVNYLMGRYTVRLRQGCRCVRLPRSMYYYRSRMDPLIAWSAFTHVAACKRAKSLKDPLHRRLQPLCYHYECSDCYRPERPSPGGI